MEQTNVMAYFVIGGDTFDPSDITRYLGITPDSTGQKGDELYNGKHKRIETTWEVKINYEASFDVNDQIGQLLIILKSKREEIKNVLQNTDLYGRFIVVVNVEQGIFPAMYLEKEFIDFMSYIGAQIDFDCYYFS